MARPTLRDRWYEQVIRTSLVTGGCRELLSLIAVRHMGTRGDVSVAREVLADQLGIPVKQVSNRMQQATVAGLLLRVDGGHNGRRARYRAGFATAVGPITAVPTGVSRSHVAGDQHADVGTAVAVPTEVAETGVGPMSAVPLRARAGAHLHKPMQPPTTRAGDAPPPPNGGRGTHAQPWTAATATGQGDGQDELGDYLAGRTRLATQVGQGNHRPRAREVNGSRRP